MCVWLLLCIGSSVAQHVYIVVMYMYLCGHVCTSVVYVVVHRVYLVVAQHVYMVFLAASNWASVTCAV